MAAGVESMTSNPMDWKAGVNPRIADNKDARNCMLPMGKPHLLLGRVTIKATAQLQFSFSVLRSTQYIQILIATQICIKACIQS